MRISGALVAILSFFAGAPAIALGAGDAAPPAPAPQTPVPGPKAMFPRDWFFYGDDPHRQEMLQRLDGSTAPELKVARWLVGEPTTMQNLRGKIVVLDFWGTWCGPCIQALPHTNELARTYADRGVEVIAVCDAARGAEHALEVIDKLKITCRVALDQGRATYSAYLGQWFPYYVVVDRRGIVRASGLQPQKLESALDMLIAEQPNGMALPAPASVPASVVSPAPSSDWLEGSPEQRKEFLVVEGQPALPLQLTSWLNTEPIDLSKLRGKVVLLDFWGTWCDGSLHAVESVNALAERYGKDGLVIVGACHPKGAQTMADFAKAHAIAYPIGADTTGATFRAYHVNGTPDYFLIDRAGLVRFADVANEHVEDAVKLLLAEQAPASPVPPAVQQ